MSICYKCLKSLEDHGCYGLHAFCFESWFECLSSARFGGLTPQDVDSDNITRTRSSFFHGKFKKYTAELANKKYVLKVVHRDYPYLPQVEYVSNQIAAFLKLNVPDFFFMRIEEQECFVSRHFLDGTRWQKLTHIYHYLPKGAELNVENLRDIIFEVTNKPQDVESFFQVVLCDALIGNHDRHGRNLGILSKGKVSRLSPIYDNPSYVGIETMLQADLNPRGKIYTQLSKEPTMKDYVIELKRLGVQKALTVFKHRCSIMGIENIIQVSILEPRVKAAMTKLIRKRYEEFIQNI